MADTLTSNYQWTKPQVGAAAGTWGASLNGTIDGIDNVMNACRAGSAGAYSGNRYNINWANGVAELWIDTTNEGALLTSYGGTITGSLTVNGNITAGGLTSTNGWVVCQAFGGGNANFDMADSAGTSKGVVYWNAPDNSVLMANNTSGGSVLIDAAANCALTGIVTAGVGYRGRAGVGGATSNTFNINWAGGYADLWIDATNEGHILTSNGGTMSNLTVTGGLQVNGAINSNGTIATPGNVQGGGLISTGNAQINGTLNANGDISVGGVYYGSDNNAATLWGVNGSTWSFRWDGGWGFFRINKGAGEYQIATGSARSLTYATGGGPLGINLNGNATNGTLYGIYCSVSCDERIKQNIRPSKVDALAAINAIPIDEFEIKAAVVGWHQSVDEQDKDERLRLMRKAKPRHVPIGVVAQKLQAVIPEAVYASSQADHPEESPLPPNVLTLADAALTPYLLRAIQQLTDRVNDLEARLAA